VRRWIGIGLCLVLSGCLGTDDYWLTYGGPKPSWDSSIFYGTGIIVADGVVLTARHVASDCKVIRISAASGAFRAVPATVRAVGPKHDALQLDVALLAIDFSAAPAWPAARFDDSWPDDDEFQNVPKGMSGEVGLSGLRLFGYPGRTVAPHPAITPVTHLAAVRPDDALQFHLWTFTGDAAHGFSGGPIVDPAGAILGLNFEGHQAHDPELAGKVFPNGALQSDGLGVAVSSKDLVPFLAENGVSVSSSAPARPIEDSLVQVFCFR